MLLNRLNSIKLKLLAVLLPATALALGLAFLVTVERAENQFQENLQTKQNNLRNYTAIIAEPLWNYDYSSVEKILTSMMTDQDLIAIEIQDESGTTVLSQGNSAGHAHTIDLQFPIIYRNNHIVQRAGFLIIRLTDNSLNAQKTRARNIALGTLLMIFIIMAGGTWLTFNRLLDKPIRQLVAAIKNFHAGQSNNRIAHSSNDELGTIAGAFNEMQRRIESHHDQLQQSQARLQQLYHATPALLLSFDQSGIIRDASNHFLEQLQLNRQQVLEKPLTNLLADPAQRAETEQALHSLWQEGDLIDYPLVIRDARGQSIEVLLNATLSALDSYPGALAVITDVTGLNQAHRALEHQANTDYLSGIANRYHFQNYLNTLIGTHTANPTTFALLFIDLDHFKSVNDTYGHTTGDELLCMATRRIESILRPQDKIARLGGDEFAVILNEIDNATVAEEIAQRIINTTEQNFTLAKGDIYISASVGIALYPADSTTPVGLLKCADLAMYRAKDKGRSCFAFFTPQHNALVQEQLRIETLLRHAIRDQSLELHYQPIIDLHAGQVRGVEALLRLREDDQLIPPDHFIPVAESTGLIVEIGQWCIEESCRMLAQLHRETDSDLYMSINVSTRQFQSKQFIPTLSQALVDNGIPANKVLIEITESLLLHDNQHNQDIFNKLCSLGCRIAIDDFGTGFSALSYLMNFPIDVLKIDRAFVQQSTEGRKEAGLLKAIVQMSQSMEMIVIAEGVETQTQARQLQALSQQIYVQGYLYARPVHSDLLADTITELGNIPRDHGPRASLRRTGG